MSESVHTVMWALAVLAVCSLALIVLWIWHQRERKRISELTDYLERINTGGGGVLISAKEDEFSKLQDEIYKTVTELYQTRERAVEAKNNYAENLSNIAHQLKTPITTISLLTQMIKNNPGREQTEQIQAQLERLTHLEEALLLLSRIDAGTLPFEPRETDAFTLLVLAAENLQELSEELKVSVEVTEDGEAKLYVDPDWTMEAVMNLIKNGMEHTPPGGSVYCSYEENPLYTQIRIWDTGAGFAAEDIPHLFERFYRGENAGSGGIGIGLSIAKAIIESQNGIISAYNLTDGGACFEIRLYSH